MTELPCLVFNLVVVIHFLQLYFCEPISFGVSWSVLLFNMSLKE